MVPTTGTALLTNFTLSAVGFMDEDLPIEYGFATAPQVHGLEADQGDQSLGSTPLRVGAPTHLGSAMRWSYLPACLSGTRAVHADPESQANLSLALPSGTDIFALVPVRRLDLVGSSKAQQLPAVDGDWVSLTTSTGISLLGSAHACDATPLDCDAAFEVRPHATAHSRMSRSSQPRRS